MKQLPLFELREQQYFPARGLKHDMYAWQLFDWLGNYFGVCYLFVEVSNATR